MSRIFYPSSEKLKFLRESIHYRELALPDFQRDFVGDTRETEELIERICQNFPAGSLLRIRSKAGFYFAARELMDDHHLFPQARKENPLTAPCRPNNEQFNHP